MQNGGNKVAESIYLATHSVKFHPFPRPGDTFAQKEFMRQKYVNLKWFKAPEHATVRRSSSADYNGLSNGFNNLSVKSPSNHTPPKNDLLDDFFASPASSSFPSNKTNGKIYRFSWFEL